MKIQYKIQNVKLSLKISIAGEECFSMQCVGFKKWMEICDSTGQNTALNMVLFLYIKYKNNKISSTHKVTR